MVGASTVPREVVNQSLGSLISMFLEGLLCFGSGAKRGRIGRVAESAEVPSDPRSTSLESGSTRLATDLSGRKSV